MASSPPIKSSALRSLRRNNIYTHIGSGVISEVSSFFFCCVGSYFMEAFFTSNNKRLRPKVGVEVGWVETDAKRTRKLSFFCFTTFSTCFTVAFSFSLFRLDNKRCCFTNSIIEFVNRWPSCALPLEI